MKDKIAFFLPSLEGGGAENVMVKLANGLAEEGWPVDLLLINSRGPFASLVSPKVTIHDFNASLNPYLKILAVMPFIKYLLSHKPGIVISALHSCNILAIFGKVLTGCPQKVVLTVHSAFSQEYALSRTIARKFMRRAMRLLMRYFYPKANSIVAVSNGIRFDLINWVGINSEKITVVDAQPVVDDEFWRKVKEEPPHPWLKEKNFPVIIAVGRIDQQKDYPTLLRAFKLVEDEVDARLLILGEGKERLKLEALAKSLDISKYVSMPGFVNNPYAYVSRANVFVLSSKWEALPTVLIEALACGAIIVSTDCPYGPSEILGKGKWGTLVPVGDHEALADAILVSLHSSSNRELLMERAQYYSVERVLQIYKNLIRKEAAKKL